MTYEDLVSKFLDNDVQTHDDKLRLHNPHWDETLKPHFEKQKQKLDWLHKPGSNERIDVQFIGSTYWHLDGARKYYSNKEVITDDDDWYPFYRRFQRLDLAGRYRVGNCALGYLPNMKTSTGYLSAEQIKYLWPKKMCEYATTGTRVVFAMGGPSIQFHWHGTDRRLNRVVDAVDCESFLRLENDVLVVPLPHPGLQGIIGYMKSHGCADRTGNAQDACFRQLVNDRFERLNRMDLSSFELLPPLPPA